MLSIVATKKILLINCGSWSSHKGPHFHSFPWFTQCLVHWPVWATVTSWGGIQQQGSCSASFLILLITSGVYYTDLHADYFTHMYVHICNKYISMYMWMWKVINIKIEEYQVHPYLGMDRIIVPMFSKEFQNLWVTVWFQLFWQFMRSSFWESHWAGPWEEPH